MWKINNSVHSRVHNLKATWELKQVTVLRAAEDTETTQENIQDWLELDEGDREFQLLTEEEITAVIFFFHLFSSALPILLIYPFICYLSFLSFSAIFCFINPDYWLIRLTSPPINPN
jgi:hypothetical protein